MSGIKETKETKQTPAIQLPGIPHSLPLEFSSSNNYVPVSNTTDPALPDEKEHTRRLRQASSPLDTTPLARTDAAAPATSNSKNLRELLRQGYEARAKIRSLVFTDHELPIHEVHFTLDQYNEEQEKVRLTRRVPSQETKEAKSSAYYFEKKDDKKPTNAWSSLLHQQRGGEMARQPVAVIEIFATNAELAKKAGRMGARGDDKSAASSPIHRVLIIGPPGSGKTTLSKYLTQQWSVGKLWQERYCQVFWLTLRDLGSPANFERLAHCKASAFPLAALIHQFGLDETAQQQIGIKQIHQLLTTQPQQTLLILDGFDEITQAFSDSSEASQPIKSLLTAAMAASCDLIVTSRGYSLPPSQFQFDRRLVNQGFTDEQTRSYIQQHFASLTKPDEKQTTEVQRLTPNEVQRLVQGNYRLWTHVHNPLILSLTCDFYRDAYESGKAQLTKLSLVDLYDNTLCIFIRRYLDTQSQVLDKPERAWEKTKNWSQSKLLSTCTIEIDFLQTLAFLGVQEDVQRFNKQLKKEASAAVETRHPHAEEDHFILSLQLGFLHEFPSAHASPLDRTHEFTHLTFQEYLAARYLAERLQKNDPEAYQWLRTYKYHASYRQIFDFLCGIMPLKSETFWRVLLEEQADLTGFGQWSLRLYSLEAGHFHSAIPGVRRYVDEAGQFLIHCVKIGKFTKAAELRTVLEHCPQFFSQLKEGFWRDLKSLLAEKEGEINQYAWQLLQLIAAQAGQLNSKQRQWLRTELLQAAGNENSAVQEAAVKALGRYAWQVGHLTAGERTKLLKTLLQAAGNENSAVQEAAVWALGDCAEQAGHFTADECSALLKAVLQAAGSQNFGVQLAIVNALGSHAEQAGQLTAGARSELLKTLLHAAGNKNFRVQQAAIWALGDCAEQAGHFTVDECSALLKALLHVAGNENSAVQQATVRALRRYVGQAGQLTVGERSALLKTLLQVAGSQNFHGQGAAAEALKHYTAQAGQFTAGERSELLKTLLHLAGNKNPAVQSAVVRALGNYANQAGQFTAGERIELLKTLLQAAGNKNSWVQEAAAGTLGDYAAQAGQFTAGERTELLKALLHLAGNENSHVQEAAVRALGNYAKQAGQFTAGERTELLKALLHAAGSQNSGVPLAIAKALKSYADRAGQMFAGERNQLVIDLFQSAKNTPVRAVIIAMLDNISFTRDDLLSGPFFESYFIYKEDLGKPLSVESELLLSATPLTELLYAYSHDSAEPPGELLFCFTTDTEICEAVEKGFFNSRCSLWLKFILARVAKEEVTLTIVDGGCELHSPQLARPVRVPIPEGRLQELAKVLASHAKEQSLPVYAAKPLLALPAKIESKPATSDRGDQLIEAGFHLLMKRQEQSRTEFKQEVKEIKSEVRGHEQRLENHEQRLQNAEKNIDQLKLQVQAHEIAFKAQETAMADLRKDVKAIGKELEDSIASSKAAIQSNEEELQKQEAALSKLTEQLTQREKEAKEQGKTIESLGEGYNSLQQQQRELQDKCEKSEAKLLAQYEQLADQLKTRLDAVEKADAKQDKISRDLQEKQQALEESLKKMGGEIEALKSADAHNLEELQKLQAHQEEMVKAFEAVQKQLRERQTLLSDPKFAQFYRVMHLKLSGFFLVCEVLATGLIKAEPQTSLSEKIVTTVISGLGAIIPIPGANIAASFINSMIAWHSENRTKQGREHAMDSAPISFSDKEAAIDLAVQEVIRRYGQHIKVLTEKGVADLAECGVNRIAHGIQDEELSKQSSSDNFPLYLVQFLHRVKLKQGKVGQKDIATEPGIIAQGKKPWNEDGIFRRTGIQSATQYHYSEKTEHSLVGSGKPICRYQKYGFRQVDDAKLAETMADQQQFEKTSAILPAGSFQFKPLATPLQPAPQGPLSMWGKTKQAAIGAAENKLPDAAPWVADHRRDITDGVQSAINQAGGAIASSVTTMVGKVSTISKSF